MATVSIDPKIRLKLCSELQEVAKEFYNEPTEILEVDKVKELKEYFQQQNSPIVFCFFFQLPVFKPPT